MLSIRGSPSLVRVLLSVVIMLALGVQPVGAQGGNPPPDLALAGFFDDFESGYDNWAISGLWNPEDQDDACGGMVAPFASPTSAAYYGIDGTCTYNTGDANSGSLSLNSPVAVGAGDTLSFWSYEETECGGVCPWDHRYVEISTNGGTTWTMLGQGIAEGTWYKWTYDLSAYAGQSVLIRFRFDTVDYELNAYFGWMVDNVRIGPANDAPVATDNEYTTPEDTPYSGNAVLDDTGDGVDYDPDGDPFTADTVTNPESGTLVFGPDGSFTYTPTVDYNGTVTFTYQLQEGTQIVTVARAGEPTAPSGVWATVAERAAEGARGTRPAVQPPFMLAPVGPIAFDEPEFPPDTVVDGLVVTTLNGSPIDPLSFNFTVDGAPSTDAAVRSGPGTTAYIDDPSIEGDSAGTLHVDFGVDASRVAFGFALNCAPPVSPGAMVTGYAADGTPVGSASVDGIDTGFLFAENLLVFNPGAKCRSVDITFNDMGGACWRFALDNLAYDTSPPLVSNVATVTMTVTPVNDPPLAVDDSSFLRLFGTPIDFSGDLVEIEPLTGAELNRFAAPAAPTEGPDGLAFDGSSLWFIGGQTLYEMDPDTGSVINSTIIGTGTGAYDGLAALNGLIYILDYVAYDIHVFDPSSETVVATLDIDGLNSVTIAGGLAGIHGPDALLATNAIDYSVCEIDPATGLITGSFAPPIVEFNAGLAVLGGQVYLGSYWALHYTVVDRTGTLLRVIDLPYQLSALGGDDAFVEMVTSEDALLNPTVNVLINDSDPDFDALSVAGFMNPSAQGASVTANGDGSFGYDPTVAPALQALAAGEQIVDTFTYTVTDGTDTDWATVFISVTGLNDAPVAVDDSYVTSEDTVLSIAAPGVLGNDGDVEGDAMAAVLDTAPLSSTLVLDPDGSFTYTPTLDFVGIDSFTYHAHDGLLDSGVATVTITVTRQRHLIYLPVIAKQ